MRNPITPITNKDIVNFLLEVKLLKDCKYLETSNHSKVEIIYDEEERTKFIAQMPPREEIEVILVRIRPFIEYSERYHVGRIISFLLKEYGDSDFLSKYLKVFNEDVKRYPVVTVNSKEYQIKDLFYLYLYGKYIHKDKDKQEIIDQFEKVFGSLSEYFALSQVDRYVGIVMGVAGYIIRNKLVREEGS